MRECARKASVPLDGAGESLPGYVPSCSNELLLDQVRKRPAENPGLDRGDRFGFLAIVPMGGKRVTGTGLRRFASAHRDQRVSFAQALRFAVGTEAAAIVLVVHEQQRHLHRAVVETR